MKLRNIFGIAVLLGLLLCAALAWHEVSFSSRGEERIVTIPVGTSFGETNLLLKEGGIVKFPLLFRALAEAKGVTHQIQAGEYRLNTGMSLKRVLKKLVEGDIIRYPMTVPEGFALSQIAQRLQELAICTAADFKEAAHQPELLKRLGIEASSAEGFLFPETYNLPKGASPEKIVETMVSQFWRVFNSRFRGEAAQKGWPLLQVITLASLIEKEATLEKERPMISAVFHNRLRIRMPLQSDPTVLYGLGVDSGSPTRLQLQTPSPYNTYLQRGLPPGPISNPGKGSIEAALHPANTSYLYFVSKNDGSHAFSVTLQEHNRYVHLYQR